MKNNGAQSDLKNTLSLPSPPMAPKGKWSTRKLGIFGLSEVIAELRATPPLESIYSNLPDLSNIEYFHKHDPNEFYYKPERPNEPTNSFKLTCDKWRHRENSKLFKGELHTDHRDREIIGEIECTIQADNLTTNAKKAVRVSGTVKCVNIYEMAKAMLNQL